jgi:hypothetical protein
MGSHYHNSVGTMDALDAHNSSVAVNPTDLELRIVSGPSNLVGTIHRSDERQINPNEA